MTAEYEKLHDKSVKPLTVEEEIQKLKNRVNVLESKPTNFFQGLWNVPDELIAGKFLKVSADGKRIILADLEDEG